MWFGVLLVTTGIHCYKPGTVESSRRWVERLDLMECKEHMGRFVDGSCSWSSYTVTATISGPRLLRSLQPGVSSWVLLSQGNMRRTTHVRNGRTRTGSAWALIETLAEWNHRELHKGLMYSKFWIKFGFRTEIAFCEYVYQPTQIEEYGTIFWLENLKGRDH
jgi:hypothetical protein